MTRSILSIKTELKKSKINSFGTFAIEDIKKGEMIYIRGGYILTKEELFYYNTADGYWPLSDNYFLGAKTEEEFRKQKVYVNHSCDANCGIRGEITCIAMRDIRKGEELTQDYGLLDNESYSFECNCGAENCRGIVTGHDWMKTELQKKYKGYFAAYLQEKINQLYGEIHSL